MRKSYTSRRAVIAALLTLVMTSCLGEDHLKAEQQSPTGKYKAELIAGDTGAVAGWQSIVRLSELNPSRWTRLLGREQDTFFGVDLRSTHVAFEWKDKSELEITCSGCDPGKIDVKKSA